MSVIQIKHNTPLQAAVPAGAAGSSLVQFQHTTLLRLCPCLQVLLAGLLPAFIVAFLECRRFNGWASAVVATSYLPAPLVMRWVLVLPYQSFTYM